MAAAFKEEADGNFDQPVDLAGIGQPAQLCLDDLRILKSSVGECLMEIASASQTARPALGSLLNMWKIYCALQVETFGPQRLFWLQVVESPETVAAANEKAAASGKQARSALLLGKDAFCYSSRL